MKKIFLLATALLSFIFSNGILAQTSKSPTDYLSVAGPIVFEGSSYKLTWSSHPDNSYYKQEYLPAGEAPEKYKSMILLEIALTEVSIKEVVGGKIAELKAMKASNPIVNYEMFQKDGEYIVDFVLSGNSSDGKLSIVERNVYRYKAFKDKSGKPGVLLFAISTRAYGTEANKFLQALKANKSRYVNAIAKFNIPQISIKN
ncbi:MAG: hypothetical protein EOO13_00250 [Chitinophagaceae bacterium]|nr:MAG: hypothetical protein EOO13_00250 [Chitinophagaceae bacterium]